jgi:hypothetical protein
LNGIAVYGDLLTAIVKTFRVNSVPPRFASIRQPEIMIFPAACQVMPNQSFRAISQFVISTFSHRITDKPLPKGEAASRLSLTNTFLTWSNLKL